jgi:hypothetical protein
MGAFFFHAIGNNPQMDTQGIRYAAELNESLAAGTAGEYMLEVRKYPLLYILPIAAGDALAAAAGHGDLTGMHYVGRGLTLLYAIGILVLVSAVGRRLSIKYAWLVLLMSITFFQFSTAVRPHVPVAFWTILSLYFSLRLMTSRRPAWVIGAFGSALIAFCTLQNGLLAFIFPAWAYAYPRWTAGSILRACGIAAAFLLPAVVLGYPFLLGPLFGKMMVADADLGHEVALAFDAQHGLITLMTMLGSELILMALAAAASVHVLWKRTHEGIAVIIVPVTLFWIAYMALFLFHNQSGVRFFLPVLPLWALLGAQTYGRLPAWGKQLLLLFVILIFARLGWLATQPNVYQKASLTLAGAHGLTTPGLPPAHFFDLPQDAWAVHKDEVRALIFPDSLDEQPQGSWKVCARFTASDASDANMFLWEEVQWAYFHALKARALGQNLTVYCPN